VADNDEFFFSLIESIGGCQIVEAYCPRCKAMGDHDKKLYGEPLRCAYLCRRCGLLEDLPNSKFLTYGQFY
jgi:hypothetical protein